MPITPVAITAFPGIDGGLVGAKSQIFLTNHNADPVVTRKIFGGTDFEDTHIILRQDRGARKSLGFQGKIVQGRILPKRRDSIVAVSNSGPRGRG